ncbi:MAG: FAD binding domain-containing protein [Qipengyuania citrea]
MSITAQAPEFYRSHAAIEPFALHRPKTVGQAVAAMAASRGDGAYMAGGIDLTDELRAGRKITDLIYLGDVKELAAIGRTSRALVLGGAVTYRQIERDAKVRAALPDLARIWETVANVRVRAAGSIAGNLIASRSGYDALPALMALDATLHLETGKGARTQPVGKPVPKSALVRRIEIPLTKGQRFLFDRSLTPVVSVALAVSQTAKGIEARAAVGCAHGRAVVKTLNTKGISSMAKLACAAEKLASAFADALPEPVSDAMASGAYRRRMTAVQLKRLIASLAGDA